MAYVLRLWLISLSVLMWLPSFSQAQVEEDISLPQAEVQLWGVHIITLRVSYRDMSPATRAELVARHIQDIPFEGQYKVEVIGSSEGEYSGAWVMVNGNRIFGFLRGDVPENTTFDIFSTQVASQLKEWLKRRQEQQSPEIALKGLLHSAVATAIFVLIIVFFWRGRTFLYQRLNGLNQSQKAQERIKIGGVHLLPYILLFVTGVFRTLVWAIIGFFSYIWITYVLRQFPFTEGVGERLTDYILGVIGGVGASVLRAVPDLIMVAIIYWMAKFVNSILINIFYRIETGSLSTQLFDAETAKATRRVIVIMVWIFAAIIAYPYIPGSQTEAFKGVSVFLGLMVSLGSAGIISQVLGGLIVVYSRAFQPGDFVKIGDNEGTVLVVGVLSTKIKTLRNEEVSVPNAVLLGASTLNYSRLSRADGLVITTAVTIGYDTPWRQVHELLLSAARRCGYARKNPPPRVLQTALSDWYPEYRLLIHIDSPAQKQVAMSELHQHIQDEFAAANVQIMSPHFIDQPDTPVLPIALQNEKFEPPKS